jgi:serine/threonine protein kinase
LIQQSGLLDAQALARAADELDLPAEPFACAETLVRAGLLTPFQAKQILSGRFRGLVLGPYRVERPLGSGGVGVVYLADHTSLDRKVAIKVLHPAQAREKLALERFQREARAVAALDHTNIVRVYDVTQVGGVHFLVMEYVDGTDLQTLVERTGRLHYAQAANYIAQAAAGLRHAHEKGFVHRDIKPANLILTKDGTIKILDLGLARSVVNPNDKLTNQMGEDHITGTVDFISPEQAMNVHIDARSDIYSLGATFFALLAGQPPYSGSTAQKLTQHQLAPPPSLSKIRTDVPPELNAVVARMMAKKTSERYQTAADVIDALAPWVTHPTPANQSPAPSANANPNAKKTKRKLKARAEKAARRMRLYVGGGVLAGALVAGVCATLLSGKSGPTNSAANPPAGPDPGASPPRPMPSKAPPTTQGGHVYSLDLSKVAPFNFTHQDGRQGDPDWRSKVPTGIYLHCWKRESVSMFRGEVLDGRPALGVTNLNDDLSNQMLIQLDEKLFRTGVEYRVRVEYRTTNEAEGRLYVRALKDGEFPSIADLQLSGTNGQWRWIETTFRKPADRSIDLCIVNSAVGEGNTLYFRSAEIYEGAPEKN